MPLYEYKCNACGHRFEVIQKFSDKPVKKCPHCGKTGKAVERLVSSSTFQLKGSGWYITDYARKSSPSDSGSKSDAKDGGEASKEAAAKSTDPAPPAAASSKDSGKDSGSSPLSTSAKKPKKD